MKRLAFLIIVVISTFALIPAYALERNVWTYSASAEICFETVPLSTLTYVSVEEENLIVPADEEIDEVTTTVEEERTESTSTSLDEAFALADEPDEDLIDEDISSPVGETMIDEEQTELTTPLDETEFVDDLIDKELNE